MVRHPHRFNSRCWMRNRVVEDMAIAAGGGRGSDMVPNWIPISEQMPKVGKPVIVAYRHENYKGEISTRWIRAYHVGPLEQEADNNYEGDDAVYDEATDQCYTPEGWYECNLSDEICYRVNEEFTHWAEVELPEAHP